jgi:nucleotide-binding universal stress UspA family protein
MHFKRGLTMSEIKSILLHVDASASCALRQQTAHALAQQHGAQVDALYAVTPAVVQYPYAFTMDAPLADEMVTLQEEQRDQAKANFARISAEAGGMPQLRWCETHDEPTRTFVQQAFGADLLVLGQHAPDDKAFVGVGDDFVPSVLIDSGKPALVLPFIQRQLPRSQTLVLAWKNTAEAARAANAALPWLKQAAHVHVVSWQEGSTTHAQTLPIEPWLRAQGVPFSIHHQGQPARDLGELLLSLCADFSADMLIMGCYGHGRAREWLLGGATRSVLRAMTLPVLMVH